MLSDRELQAGAGGRIQSFHYPVIAVATFRPGGGSGPVNGEAAQHARQQATQQEMAAAMRAAREKGQEEGRADANSAFTEAVASERLGITTALEAFVAERAEYFRRIETEAVRLSLSIARKVLHREAQMDPLLLTGVVRVALDQVQSGTRLILRTPPQAVEAWRAFFSEQGSCNLHLEVVADETLDSHRCRLEAEVGTTEISLESQLEEIEKGFFDLLRDKDDTDS